MLLLLPLLVAISPPVTGACACSCWGPGPLDGAFARSEAVFTGRVTGISWDASGQIATVRLSVATAWKWPQLSVRPPAEIVVATTHGPACGAYFGPGEEWLVFAQAEFARADLWTGQCTGTERFDAGEEAWQRRRHRDAEERVRWLQRNVGPGARPGQ